MSANDEVKIFLSMEAKKVDFVEAEASIGELIDNLQTSIDSVFENIDITQFNKKVQTSAVKIKKDFANIIAMREKLGNLAESAGADGLADRLDFVKQQIFEIESEITRQRTAFGISLGFNDAIAKVSTLRQKVSDLTEKVAYASEIGRGALNEAGQFIPAFSKQLRQAKLEYQDALVTLNDIQTQMNTSSPKDFGDSHLINKLLPKLEKYKQEFEYLTTNFNYNLRDADTSKLEKIDALYTKLTTSITQCGITLRDFINLIQIAMNPQDIDAYNNSVALLTDSFFHLTNAQQPTSSQGQQLALPQGMSTESVDINTEPAEQSAESLKSKFESALGSIGSKIAGVGTKLLKWSKDVTPADIALKALKGTVNGVVTVVKGATTVASKFVSLLASGAKKGASAIKTKLANSFKKVGSSIGNSHKKVSGFFKYMMRYLGRRLIYQALQQMVQSFKQAFNTMATQIPEINTTMSSFKTALNQVKGSIGTAFQPLASVVLPILTKFLNMITAVLNKVGQFTAALTGQGYTYEFVSDNIDAATEATKDKNKADKKSIAGFDEINQLSSNDSSNDSSNSDTLSGTYKKVALESNSITDAATKIRDMIKSGEWDELASYIGEKLNLIMSKINNFLTSKNWYEIGNSIGSAISSFITSIDFGLMAKTISNGLLAIIRLVRGFINGIDWQGIGRKIADFLNGIKWKDIITEGVGTISDIIVGLQDMMIEAVEETDWGEIGEAIGAGLQAIDWVSLIDNAVTMALDVLEGVLDAIIGFFEGTDAKKAGQDGLKILANLQVRLEEKLPVIGEKLLKALESMFTWLWESLKSFLGIHSPSTKTHELAENLVAGFVNGLTDKWEDIKKWWEDTKTKIKKKWEDIKTWIKTKWDEFKTKYIDPIVSKFKSVKDSILSILSQLRTQGKKILSNIKTGIKNVVNWIIGKVEGFVNGVITGINWIISKFNKLSSSMPQWVKDHTSIGDFSVKELDKVTIPRLATGAVVPPNKEFLATLGDNKKETEIVSPLSTIKQALKEALSESGNSGGGVGSLEVYLSTADVTKAVVKQINSNTRQTGTCPIKLTVL